MKGSLARDNGGAMVDIRRVSDEALPRLFDTFTASKINRNRSSGGIGLGLSIARRAMDLHKDGLSPGQLTGWNHGTPRGVGGVPSGPAS